MRKSENASIPSGFRGRRPADHRRQGAGNGADCRVQGRPRLQRGVDEDVKQERGDGNRGSQPVGTPEQDRRARQPQSDPERGGLDRANRPLGSARLAVRRIRASRHRSIHWFSVLAPPATRAVPSKVSDSVAG